MKKVDVESDEFRELVENAINDCMPDPVDFTLPGYTSPGWDCVVEHIADELSIEYSDAENLLNEYLELDEIRRRIEELDTENWEKQTPISRWLAWGKR